MFQRQLITLFHVLGLRCSMPAYSSTCIVVQLGCSLFAMETSSKSTLRSELVSVGFVAEQTRWDVVLGFLLLQEIYSLDDFEGAPLPFSVAHLISSSLTGLRPFGRMAGSAVLSREEISFLEALAKSMCRPRKRKALGQAAPVCTLPAKQPQSERAEELLSLPESSNLAIAACGPRAAGRLLTSVLRSNGDRNEWVSNARIQAIVGSCAKSHASAKSGMRFWRWFAVHILGYEGDVLPPRLDGLLAWSRLFRCHQTFGNYVSYVKLACEIKGACVDVFGHPSLRRAKTSIEKRRLFMPRTPTWVCLEVLQKLVTCVLVRPELRELVMLFIASYAFLLRLPSEGIPMAAHSAPEGCQAPVLSVAETCVTLWFPTRKNKLWPTKQVRACWCRRCTLTCPVHVLGAYMRTMPAGTQPFAHIRASQALLSLRELLAELHIPNAAVFRTHDFRRGHAEDLRRGGSRLYEILAAGDWKSGAFLAYLDRVGLERDQVIEAQTGFVDSDEEADGLRDSGD